MLTHRFFRHFVQLDNYVIAADSETQQLSDWLGAPEAGSHGSEADDEEEEHEEEEEDAGDGVHDGGSGGIGDWLEKIISCYSNHDVDM